ncbi:unannotated protein [freshwater metagenome]|uniref:Unannotated protein n=1 Tax=freshwater metagenome TaxID=449393 RepID=A0A6J7D385_9ZZZZ
MLQEQQRVGNRLRTARGSDALLQRKALLVGQAAELDRPKLGGGGHRGEHTPGRNRPAALSW